MKLHKKVKKDLNAMKETKSSKDLKKNEAFTSGFHSNSNLRFKLSLLKVMQIFLTLSAFNWCLILIQKFTHPESGMFCAIAYQISFCERLGFLCTVRN